MISSTRLQIGLLRHRRHGRHWGLVARHGRSVIKCLHGARALHWVVDERSWLVLKHVIHSLLLFVDLIDLNIVLFFVMLLLFLQTVIFLVQELDLPLGMLQIFFQHVDVVFLGAVVEDLQIHSFNFSLKTLRFFNVIIQLCLKLREVLLAEIEVIGNVVLLLILAVVWIVCLHQWSLRTHSFGLSFAVQFLDLYLAGPHFFNIPGQFLVFLKWQILHLLFELLDSLLVLTLHLVEMLFHFEVLLANLVLEDLTVWFVLFSHLADFIH